jgi:hypothetical protein
LARVQRFLDAFYLNDALSGDGYHKHVHFGVHVYRHALVSLEGEKIRIEVLGCHRPNGTGPLSASKHVGQTNYLWSGLFLRHASTFLRELSEDPKNGCANGFAAIL